MKRINKKIAEEQWLFAQKLPVEGIMGDIHKLTTLAKRGSFINFLPFFVFSLSTSLSTKKAAFSGAIPHLFPKKGVIGCVYL